MTLFVDGNPVPLGNRIGRGGEGEVFAVANDPTRAIKVYTDQNGPAREAKIAAMIQKGFAQQTRLVAFPLAIARDPGRRFKGFVMNLVRDHKPVYDLYGPQARKQQFPGADYRFLVRSALNTARAIAAVHKSGCVIGDINHSGILVSNEATVALIDADSFQVIDGSHRYLCRVGVPEYTPPELQGVPLGDVVRTENHDAFGLAVAVFLLLGMGRHPFVGAYARGEMPLPQAISEFRFAYSRRPEVAMTPPPGVCTLDDFPVPVATAFEAAFGPAGTKSRPSAAQWVALLEEFERSLRTCARNPLHHYSSAAYSCPWCRMEQKLRIILFLPKALGINIPGAGADDFNLPLLWAQIEALRAPSGNEILPAFATLTPPPSAEAVAAKSESPWPNIVRIGAIVAAIALIAAAPALLFFAIGAVWIAFKFSSSNSDDFGVWKQRFLSLEAEWNQALDQWEQRLGLEKIENLKASLVDAKKAYEALETEKAERLRRYQNERENLQRSAFLERFRIRDHKITGIGPSKLATLASYGVETAADVTQQSVLAIAGFGPLNSRPLFEWQQRCARGFVYNPQPTMADQVETDRIKTDYLQQRQTLRQKLQSEARQFGDAVQACKTLISRGDATLEALYARRKQIEADLTHLAIPFPPRPVRRTPHRAAPRAAAPRAFQTSPQPQGRPNVPPSASSATPTCPRCRQPMVRRIAHRGRHSGQPFWGCSRYPRCKGTRPI